MKIACLIGPPAYLYYFVNTLAESFPLELVVREHTPANRLWDKIRKKGMLNSTRIIYHKLRTRTRYRHDYDQVLGDKWLSLPPNTPLLQTHDINEKTVARRLKEIKPDIVLVHGTSLIRKETLEGIPLVLNLHWGLSPYYKGSFCTDWALLNHDPYNIGFTIHKIDPTIDGGDILTQGRVDISPEDTAHRINMKLTQKGTLEMVKVLKRLASGEKPLFVPQQKEKGIVYLTRHWNRHYIQLVSYLERSGAVGHMLQKPSRKALPIIEWISKEQ